MTTIVKDINLNNLHEQAKNDDDDKNNDKNDDKNDDKNQTKRRLSSYTSKQKEYIYAWRMDHKDKYNELMRKHNLKFYYRNKDILLERKRAKYHLNKSLLVD